MTTVVQDTKNTNSLAQTFNNTLGGTPAQGNLLIATIWHDEASTDIAALTSSGWLRMGTVGATLNSVAYRLSVWAKFAGASESTTISWDLGEGNRRAHGYVVELSGTGVTELNAEDGAVSSSHAEGVTAGTSNQVDDVLEVKTGQLAYAMVGLNGTSASTPSWAADITEHEDWSNNFRATAVGYADPAVEIQPTATWGSGRHSLHAVFALGTPPPVSKVLAGSTFRASKVG